MDSKKLFRILLSLVGVLILAIIIGAWQFDKQFQAKASQLVDQRRQLAVLDSQQQALTKAKADIQKYQQLADIAKSIVPQDKSQAETVLEIVKIAHASGVDIGAITFPSSNLGGKTTTSPKLSQLEAVKGIPGVYSLQIVVANPAKQTVDYSKFIDFLQALENNRRTALVSTVSITPDPDNSSKVSFSLTLEEYVKP